MGILVNPFLPNNTLQPSIKDEMVYFDNIDNEVSYKIQNSGRLSSIVCFDGLVELWSYWSPYGFMITHLCQLYDVLVITYNEPIIAMIEKYNGIPISPYYKFGSPIIKMVPQHQSHIITIHANNEVCIWNKLYYNAMCLIFNEVFHFDINQIRKCEMSWDIQSIKPIPIIFVNESRVIWSFQSNSWVECSTIFPSIFSYSHQVLDLKTAFHHSYLSNNDEVLHELIKEMISAFLNESSPEFDH